MLNIGDIVAEVDDGTTGSVTALYETSFDVYWGGKINATPVNYSYGRLFAANGRAPEIRIVQSDIPTNVALANIGSERSMAMSHNIGRMEATIEILHDRIMRMREAADIKGSLDVTADCDAMLNTISTCVSRLKDLPSVDGGSKVSDLKVNLS